MSATRKYYILTAVIFAIGAVLAVIKTQTVALIVFVVLLMMMLWIQSRVDRVMEVRRPGEAREQADRTARPSERRRRR